MVQDQHSLGEEEGQEADRDQRRRLLRVADQLDPLRQDVEEGDGDDDAAGQRDHGRERVGEAQRDVPADQGRDHRQAGERNHDQLGTISSRSRPGRSGSGRAAGPRGGRPRSSALLLQLVDRPLQRRIGEGREPPALVADEVVMVELRVEALVAGRIATDIDPLDQVQLLELLEGPVDAGPARRRGACPSPGRSARSRSAASSSRTSRRAAPLRQPASSSFCVACADQVIGRTLSENEISFSSSLSQL